MRPPRRAVSVCGRSAGLDIQTLLGDERSTLASLAKSATQTPPVPSRPPWDWRLKDYCHQSAPNLSALTAPVNNRCPAGRTLACLRRSHHHESTLHDETLPRVPPSDFRAGLRLPTVRSTVSGARGLRRLGLRIQVEAHLRRAAAYPRVVQVPAQPHARGSPRDRRHWPVRLRGSVHRAVRDWPFPL